MNTTPPREASPVKPPAEARFERFIGKVIQNLGRSLDVSFSSSPFRPLKKRFVIACSPRTGSHLLCQGLQGYGAVVDEFFNVDRIENVSNRRGFESLAQYCTMVIDEFAKSTVFGVKGAPAILAPLILSKELPDLAGEWKFVFLRREDTVKQVISQYIAGLTGSFDSLVKPKRDLTDDDFDGPRIALLRDRRLEDNEMWEEVFSLYSVNPLRITYEELAADVADVTMRTAEFLSLDGPPVTDKRFVRPPLEVQATALNSHWEERFHQGGW